MASDGKRSAAATLDVGMEEISGGGTDLRPTQIVLVFDAGGNCVGDTALINPLQALRGDTLQSTNGGM